MTSDCAGDQVSHGPDGSTLVKATGAIGGHDRLNEAPRYGVWFYGPWFFELSREERQLISRDGQPG